MMEKSTEADTKKPYETPVAEKIAFSYQNQVAASTQCTNRWTHAGIMYCEDTPILIETFTG